jgi:hypothetical protein
MQVSLVRCKNWLTILWFTGSGFLFILLLIQGVLGHYGEKANEAWSWLLPTIMPTLSLIIGVLVSDAANKGAETQTVDRFLFILSFILSLVYLVAVALSILLQPFTSVNPLELMRQSNFWLGPFQGLVSAAIGAFFVKRKQA